MIRERDDWADRKRAFQHYAIDHHISQNCHTTSHYKPSRLLLLLQRLFLTQPCHDRYLPLFLEESINLFIQQFELFWVLALNPRSPIHACLCRSYFLSAVWLPQDQLWSLWWEYSHWTNVNHAVINNEYHF